MDNGSDRPALQIGDPVDGPFTPPAQRSLIPWVILVVVVVAGALWSSGQFEETNPSVGEAPKPIEPAATAASGAIEQGVDETPVQLHPAPGPETHTQTWKRCTLDGRVTYTDGACPPGSQVAEVDLTPNSGWTGSSSAGMTTIQRCKTGDGRFFWSASPCNVRKALVDRYATVTAGVPFQQQVREAEALRSAAAPSVPPTNAPTVPASAAGNSKAQQCAALDAHIAQLDARARQPLPAYEQDRIRVERKAARDQQFALKC